MRDNIKRGGVSNRIEYARLGDAVWNEVYSLDKEGVILHDCDIQNIAMTKALEMNRYEFKVCEKSNDFKKNYRCEISCFLSYIRRQAMVGFTISKKSTTLLNAISIDILWKNQLMMKSI